MSAIKKEDVFMTSQEMLDRSSSWTLACDNALLNRLKRFSEKLTQNSQEILRECDTLSSTVTQLDYRLINVSNEFLMLSNTQFVENRVEEFEEFSSSVSSSSGPTIQKSKAEREAALLNKMKQAIHLGLTACNERRQTNEALGNRFKTKQPYLIGSPKFFSSKYCGLVDETRREVPSFQDSFDVDSISIQDNNVMNTPVTQAKPEVKFTMPPTPVFPVKVPETVGHNQNLSGEHYERQENFIPQQPAVLPSPTISNRSSELGVGGDSGSSVSREHMPQSITDELNKIYGSFAPPPTGDADSDDDFRPGAGVGRLFDDDDDDIFGEKELFPPNQKKTDFFGRSNLSQPQLPVPVFSVPPPIEPVPQSKPVTTASDAQTAVGHMPETEDIPNTNRGIGNAPNNDASVRGTKKSGLPPEAEEPLRTKLPPGAVSLFGGLPPPVFNNGTLQAAQTANIPSFVAKPDTQVSSQSSVKVGNEETGAFSRDNVVLPSQTREDVNHKSATSLPSHNNVTAPGRNENIISQGSLSGSGTASSKAKTPQSVPVSFLFADESSDEDIFLASRKQRTVNTRDVIQKAPREESPIVPLPKQTVPVPVKTVAIKPVEKSRVKKSIFDDSDSEDDLFSSKSSAPRVENQKKTITSDKKSLFKSDSKQSVAKALTKVNNKNKSLFGDDSDSDTDLFGNKKKIEAKPSAFPSTSKGSALPSKAFPKMEDVKIDSGLEKEDLFEEGEQQSTQKQTIEALINNNHNNNNNEANVGSTAFEKSVVQSSSSESINESVPASAAQDFSKREELKKAHVKKSIFDDSESDDDLFSTKPASTKVTDDSNNVFVQKRPVPAAKLDKGKRSSLFGDDSDSDSDLFATKAKKTEPAKSENTRKEIQVSEPTRRDSLEATGDDQCNQSSDEVDGGSLASKEQKNDIPNSCDEPKEEDEPKSAKVLGNKISEKIKAMQNTKLITAKSDNSEVGSDSSSKKNIKGKVSVKSLALNLNINPLALKVGAKPPKTPTPGTPETDGKEEPPSMNNASSNVTPSLSSPDKSIEEISKSNSDGSIATKDDCTDKLVGNDSKKGKVSVKSLALNLNINPLALKVGAKPPKTPTPGTPETDGKEEPPSMNNASSNVTPTSSSSPDKSITIEDVLKSNSGDSIASKDECMNEVADDDSKITPLVKEKPVRVDDLVGILKARVKIQNKRRPPSRNFLKSLAVHNESEPNNQEEQRSSVEKDEDVAGSESKTTDDEGKEDGDINIERGNEETDDDKVVESD